MGLMEHEAMAQRQDSLGDIGEREATQHAPQEEMAFKESEHKKRGRNSRSALSSFSPIIYYYLIKSQ